MDDQLEKRRIKCSIFNSVTYTPLDSWSSIGLRAKLLNLRFFTIAIEFMNPNLSSSSGSSRNHGCKSDDSLRWINFVKNIVDWLVQEFFRVRKFDLNVWDFRRAGNLTGSGYILLFYFVDASLGALVRLWGDHSFLFSNVLFVPPTSSFCFSKMKIFPSILFYMYVGENYN